MLFGQFRDYVELAGMFSEAFSLRGYDSVHLASVRQAERSLKDDVVFACFDRRLSKAARAVGLEAPFGDA